MDAFLRILSEYGIQDYDLSKDTPVREGDFSAFPYPGGWCFQSVRPVLVNGQTVSSGQLHINDVLVLDDAGQIAAMVVQKRTGRSIETPFAACITVGRKRDNDIELQDPQVSGHHCQVGMQGGRIFVQDLGSTNGTFVNDKRVDTAWLNRGDVIKLGSYRFRIGKHLVLENADRQVNFHVTAKPWNPSELFAPKPYPWFSRAARMRAELSPLHIRIESAPSIGDKPSMGMPGLALSPEMIAMSLGMQALRYGLSRHKYSQQEEKRKGLYANYLAGVEAQLQEHAQQQRAQEEKLHPATVSCMNRVFGPAADLWERTPTDSDFLTLRLGLGTVAAAAQVEAPAQRLSLQTDELDQVPSQIASQYAQVEQVPICCDLIKHGNCGVIGSRSSVTALAHSFVAQLASLHSYEEVKIVALFPQEERSQWRWMRWLPHCLSEDRTVRYMACGDEAKQVLKQLEPVIQGRLNNDNQWNFGQKNRNLPHYIFLVADPALLNQSPIGTALMMNRGDLGISGIFLGQTRSDFPNSVRNVLEVAGSSENMQLSLWTEGIQHRLYSREHCISAEQYDKFARAMAPVRLMGTQSHQQGLPSCVGLLEGLHISDAEQLDINDLWNNTAPEHSLSVPIGIQSNGEQFYFNIHQRGHGPHGMVAGGTGSGKSQMAQAWIASMALQFSPRDVNFVLVDFKGKSLLQPLARLPHLAGTISNLDKDVARSFCALESELDRRQQLLGDYQCQDIIEYFRKRRMNPSMPEMPYLFLVVDEFAEFKLKFPDFTKPMDHLYRGGRSLGMHVILMTQSPAGIVTDQVRANANFRWCLGVKSDADSREMLGTQDAAAIRTPGRVYVKSNDTYELIQSFYPGMSYCPGEEKEKYAAGRVFSVALNGERTEGAAAQKQTYSGKTELDVLVERIAQHCRRNRIPEAKPLWQKELPEKLELFSEQMQQALWSAETSWQKTDPTQGPLATFGLADDPAHQNCFTLQHDFWKQGHLALYGMPVSGKTTFLQTLQVSLCSRYTPERVQIYSVDIGGFGLRALETFPHVGAAAGDDEPEVIAKIAALLPAELDRRKKAFRRVGAGSPGAYAEATGEILPTVILAVDNLNLTGSRFPELNETVLRLSREGASYGMYLVCTFTGSVGVSYQLSQSIKTVYALQMADKTDYNTLVGRPERALPDGVMGRGLCRALPTPLLFQTAIAFADLSDSKRIPRLRAIADDMNKAWKGIRPEGVCVIPQEISFGGIEGNPFVLGMDISSGEPVCMPFGEQISLLISDGANVSQDALLSILRQAADLTDSSIWLCSNRPNAYTGLGDHCHTLSAEEMDNAVEQLAQELRSRQAQLRQDPNAKFSAMVIAIDDLTSCVEQCKQETIARLEVFIRLGKGLGLFMVVADSAERMGKLRFRGDILTATLRQGSLLLIGGNVSKHQITDPYELQEQFPQPLGCEDGILIIKDCTPRGLRRMRGH